MFRTRIVFAILYLVTICATALLPQFCLAQSAEAQALPGNAKVVFLADNSTGVGPQPYITDGTSAGTKRIPLPASVNGFLKLLALPGKVAICWDTGNPPRYYISFVDSKGKVDNWRAPLESAIVGCQKSGSTAYLTVQTGGRQFLYSSRGTSASTKIVGSAENHQIGRVFRFNGADYVTTFGYENDNTVRVYKITGTRLVRAFDYSTDPNRRSCCVGWETQVGNRLLFANWTVTHGVELWTTDGTNAGKHLLKAIYPGQTGSIDHMLATSPVVAGGRLIFLATDPFNGTELWASDGTSIGTVRLTSIPDDTAAKEAYRDESIMAYGTKAYFAVSNMSLGRQDGYGHSLFVTDGTKAGTKRIPFIVKGKELLIGERGAVAGGWLYTRAMPYDIPGCRRQPVEELHLCNDALYRYNISSGVMQLVKDINSTYVAFCKSACDISSSFTAVGTGIAFAAADRRTASNPPSFDTEPWSSLGTAATTMKIKDIAPSVVGSNPYGFTKLLP